MDLTYLKPGFRGSKKRDVRRLQRSQQVEGLSSGDSQLSRSQSDSNQSITAVASSTQSVDSQLNLPSGLGKRLSVRSSRILTTRAETRQQDWLIFVQPILKTVPPAGRSKDTKDAVCKPHLELGSSGKPEPTFTCSYGSSAEEASKRSMPLPNLRSTIPGRRNRASKKTQKICGDLVHQDGPSLLPNLSLEGIGEPCPVDLVYSPAPSKCRAPSVSLSPTPPSPKSSPAPPKRKECISSLIASGSPGKFAALSPKKIAATEPQARQHDRIIKIMSRLQTVAMSNNIALLSINDPSHSIFGPSTNETFVQIRDLYNTTLDVMASSAANRAQLEKDIATTELQMTELMKTSTSEPLSKHSFSDSRTASEANESLEPWTEGHFYQTKDDLLLDLMQNGEGDVSGNDILACRNKMMDALDRELECLVAKRKVNEVGEGGSDCDHILDDIENRLLILENAALEKGKKLKHKPKKHKF